MTRLSAAFGRLFDALAMAAALILLGMVVTVTADIVLRNTVGGGLVWANEVSEYSLYLMTLLTAPWLLRRGQHIRVDIVLRAVPPRVGWLFEWAVDILGLACCAIIFWYSARAAFASFKAGSLSIKTLVTPEWWLLSVLPIAFACLTLEMLFRMRRLWFAPRAPRDDAVSTG